MRREFMAHGKRGSSPALSTKRKEILMDWKNKDGDKYIKRNQIDYRKRIPFLNKTLPKDIDSVLELGANCGHNLQAIKEIGEKNNREIDVHGIEINKNAVKIAKEAYGIELMEADIVNGVIYGFSNADLVMTWGVLIHINPIDLGKVFENLNKAATKYILMIEHKEQYIRTIADRWYKDGGSMWVMDFSNEFIKRYPEWKVKKQGWASGKKPKEIDYTAPVDDSNIHPADYFWLLERR